tara:strand:- start:822 stop:1013 length:192 start_codon:yes stop_codon:yes gene_type:complete
MGYFDDNGEKSMRRLIAFWAMSLLTSMVTILFFGIVIDTQVFVVVGGIATVAIGSAAVKNKKI